MQRRQTTSRFTASDVAALLQVPVSWVYAEARAGRIPHVTLGHYRRFRREASRPGWPPPSGGQSGSVRLPLEETPMARRPAGTGNLFVRMDANGRETYYATWYAAGRKVKRRIGATRVPGTRTGLTKTQAEAELRRLMGEVRASVPRQDRISLELAGQRYIDHLETVKRRKPTTITDYRTILRRHLAPFTAGRTIDAVDRADLPAGGTNPNIRYLRPEELEALYRAVPDDDLGPTERALYMTGAMAGLRLGELIGLSWQDIDWSAGVIRVRRSFTHGAWSAPKSRTSSRAVPLADRLGGEVERHYQRSAFGHDDDLVLAHPLLGTVLDGSKLRKRFHAALERAEVHRVRLHDLRHSFGTAMAAAGRPMRALMEFMGHATMQTTMIYADYSARSVRRRGAREPGLRGPWFYAWF